MLRFTILVAGALVLVVVLALGTALLRPPAAARSSALHFKEIEARIDVTGLPPTEHYMARDGAALAYRSYPGRPDGGLVVLVHGSSASNIVMNNLAKALSAKGFNVVTPDIRGHGLSGAHGDIAYDGQLDDDMADLVRVLGARFPGERRVLAGHSSGGGFILRIDGGPHACLFDGYLALSPYINYRAPTQRAGTGWASVSVPRIFALTVLRHLGFTQLEGLPVIAYAIPPRDQANATLTYSYRLWRNFGLDPMRWQNELRHIARPTIVLAGAEDELFNASAYAPLFARLQPRVIVRVVPHVDHMGMVLDPAAVPAIARALHDLLAQSTRLHECTS